MTETDAGLFQLDATAHKERSEVTPAEVRNGVIGWVELASRMRANESYDKGDPETRAAYAAAIMDLMAFCVEFAEPMASLPEARADWRHPVHTLAMIARAQRMPGVAGRVLRSAVEGLLGKDVFK